MTVLGQSLAAVSQAIRGLGEPEQDYEWTPTLPGLGAAEDTRNRSVYTGREPSTNRAGLLDIASAQLGAPYIWAAENPEGPEGGEGAGFDCSGFTKYVLGELGIETVHLASGQQSQFPKIGREDLQPGDLVFFNYGRKAAGVADHVGLYIGNGMMIDASSSQGQIVKRPVDWDNFIGGGDTGALAEATGNKRPEPIQAPVATGASAVSGALANLGSTVHTNTSIFGDVFAGLFGFKPTETRTTPGKNGGVKAQLIAGFKKAGREDLARMVRTRDFYTWVNAESGWRPYVTSQYYEGHGVNYGLFQFWEGHEWTDKYVTGGEWTATPYEQALLVARYFPGLRPEDIRRYAQQVRSGTYHGWPD